MTPYTFTKRVFAFFFLGGALVISFSILAYAQEVESTVEEGIVQGITFPIAELGNCADKQGCARFCNEPGNMPACIRFARAHGLMNEEEASRAEKFYSRIETGAGPGGCRSPRDCEAYCSTISNIEECVRFADAQGFSDLHVEEGKKILTYLHEGGSTPGGCNSKTSCEQYCSDFTHAEECFEFAERAGITQVRVEVSGRAGGRFSAVGGESGIPPGQFQKFLELIKRGETPGGCKSKNECERYCSDHARFEECVAFGERAGFINPTQAEKIRATGGRGPGGCDSPEACQRYCNDPMYQEECFKFAEEHGFISKEGVQRAKEGFVQLRVGLEQAPPEVAACMKSMLGSNIIEDIQLGKLTPGPEIGERVQGCFEKFGQTVSVHEPFADAPPEVVACLTEKLGDTFEAVRSGRTMPTPEMADTFRICFNKVQFMERGMEGGFAPGMHGEPSPDMFYEFLRTAPPGITDCLQRRLGDEYTRLKAGEIQPGPDFERNVSACFEEYQPYPIGVPMPIGTPMPMPMPIGVPSPDGGHGSICPAMPTVDRCPPGEEKVVVYESRECGVYYGCVKSGTTVPPPGPGGTVCIQVITPAQDPATGECRKFPTPCDVPRDWKLGCEGYTPGTSGTYSPEPVKLIEPFIAPLTQPVYVCGTEEECRKVCFDSYYKYYNTAECEKFRSSIR